MHVKIYVIEFNIYFTQILYYIFTVLNLEVHYMDVIDEIKKILKKNDIYTIFQPIISLKNGSIVGYEAFARGPKDSKLHNPSELFAAAEKCNRLWDLETLCLNKSIASFKKFENNSLLFININPFVIQELHDDFFTSRNISPNSVVFELSKFTPLKNYTAIKNILTNYLTHEYKLALDSNYISCSLLYTLSETKPNFLKLNMKLIRNIDTDYTKQAIIKSFVTLATSLNIKLIAEGIESEEELKIMIALGIDACQGYFIQKPSKIFLDINSDAKKIILDYNKSLGSSIYSSTSYIGLIAAHDPPFPHETTCSQLKKFFKTSKTTGVSIVKDNVPLGLVMEHTLDSMLATQYGNAVFSRRPVSLIMDTKALIVDYYSLLNHVSQEAMSRDNEKLYDNIIVTQYGQYYGIVSVKKLLDSATMLEKNYARDLNPLSGLPGNSAINLLLNNLLTRGEAHCVLYFDLDNFKVYNDVYGFENGDKIIKFTADLIQEYINPDSFNESFVGHIGGDDFVAVLQAPFEDCTKVCTKLTTAFDEKVLYFFNETDREKGYLTSSDRKGNEDTFPLTSVSISSLYGNFDIFNSAEEISKYISEIKKIVKTKHKSNYLINLIDEIKK